MEEKLKSKNLSNDPDLYKQDQDGFVLWICGLSGSGKSTLAKALRKELNGRGNLSVSLLDGDHLRSGLNEDLGFDEASREENLRRAAHVARLMALNSQVCIASFITPTRETRSRVKAILSDVKHLLIGLDCDLEVCESRDPKGLYSKARRGVIAEFTGIDSPFHSYEGSEIDGRVNSSNQSVEATVQELLELLEERQTPLFSRKVS